MHLSHARAWVFEVDVFVPLYEVRLALRSAHFRHLGVAEQRQEGFTGQGFFLRVRAHGFPPVVYASRILAASRGVERTLPAAIRVSRSMASSAAIGVTSQNSR